MLVTLTNSGDSHTLQLPEGNAEALRVRLTWTKDTEAGLLQRLVKGDKVDLDLGCYYELRDGERTLIDCLQFAGDQPAERSVRSKQGCYDAAPYIWHTGDDEGKSDDSAEEILINPAGLGQIGCITVYTYIFDGPATWRSFGAEVSLAVPGGEEVKVELDGDGTKLRFCAAMHIEVDDQARTLTVTKLGTMHRGHSDCDAEYGWGLNYRQLN